MIDELQMSKWIKKEIYILEANRGSIYIYDHEKNDRSVWIDNNIFPILNIVKLSLMIKICINLYCNTKKICIHTIGKGYYHRKTRILWSENLKFNVSKNYIFVMHGLKKIKVFTKKGTEFIM